jgi:hypothetical protein
MGENPFAIDCRFGYLSYSTPLLKRQQAMSTIKAAKKAATGGRIPPILSPTIPVRATVVVRAHASW